MGHRRLIFKSNTGQTLVETVAAVFILAMGISSALGLAIYANSTSTSITKQIIATGLAREGVEAVKNMRDTNWLKQTTIDRDCYNFQAPTATSTAASCPGELNSRTCCYKNWLTGPNCPAGTSKFDGYCINPNPPGHQIYRLQLDLNAANREWVLTPSPTSPYNLYMFQNANWNDPMAFQGLYQYSPAAGYSLSDYSREILLITDNSAEASANNGAYPFNQSDIGPQLEIVSRVWWTDKKCPASQDWPGLGKCSIEIREFLTNWKNY